MSVMRYWMCPFSISIDDKTGFKMPSRGLKLIGVRFYLYDGKSRDDERKARCIQNPCMVKPIGSILIMDLKL